MTVVYASGRRRSGHPRRLCSRSPRPSAGWTADLWRSRVRWGSRCALPSGHSRLSDEPALEHWLGASRATGQPRSHEVGFVRRLDEEELGRITAADDLIIRLANSASYQRCVSVLHVVETRAAELSSEERPSASLIEGLRSALGSLAEALQRLADDISVGASDELAAAVQAARDGPIWRQIGRVADPSSGALHRRKTGAVVWRATANGELIDVIAASRAAVLVGQLLVAQQFLALEADIRMAAKLLRELTVEVLEGTPTIFTVPTPMLEGGGPGQMTPRPLALDRLDAVLASARLARQHLDADQPARRNFQPASDPIVPSDVEPPEEADDKDGPSVEGRPEVEEGATGEGDAEASGDDGGESTPEPVVLGPLFREARELQQSLEHVWSRGLDQALLTPALAEQLAAVHSLLAGFGVKIGAEDRRLQDAGVEPRLAGWPADLATLGALDRDRDHDDIGRSRELRMAQLNALHAVLEVLPAFNGPSTIQVSFGPGEVERVDRFWDAGAFSLLRARLGLLERLTAEHESWLERRSRTSDGREAQGERRRTLDRLFLGARALAHGDPEGALLHAAAALAERFGSEAGEISAAIRELATTTEHLPAEAGDVLERAVGFVRNLTRGEDNLAAATLLAQDTLALTHGLLVGPVPDEQMSGRELADLFEADLPETESLEDKESVDE
jgi:hypothetical protein